MQPETSKHYIYLDAAASSSSEDFYCADNFANPNATHDAGRDAFAILESTRESFAHIIGAKRPSEIVWTSGATESNNIAILGIARAIKNSPNNIRTNVLICATDHESSLLPAQHLSEEGFNVEIMSVDRNGFVDIKNFENLCDEITALVVCHHANTEIGAIQNIENLCKIAHKNGALLHCDCVGSLGWININVQNLGMDSASFSGHKLGAPKGIGALYLKAKTPCEPIMFGGSQELGIRPGTQPVSLAHSFISAVEYAYNNLKANVVNYEKFQSYIANEIAHFEGVRLTIDYDNQNENYLRNILSLVFKNENSKNLILQYEKQGIIVSGGPACSAESDEPSHVLKAIGVPNNEIDGEIRISFSPKTSFDDVKCFVSCTKEILKGK